MNVAVNWVEEDTETLETVMFDPALTLVFPDMNPAPLIVTWVAVPTKPCGGSMPSMDGNTAKVTLLLAIPSSLTLTLYVPAPAWAKFNVASTVAPSTLDVAVPVRVPVVPVWGEAAIVVVPPLKVPLNTTETGESSIPALDGLTLVRDGPPLPPGSQFGHHIG